MRYYEIQFQDPDSGAEIFLPSLQQRLTTLLADGTTNQAALDVELDILATLFDAPESSTSPHLRIWGVSIDDINMAFTLGRTLSRPNGGANIIISGGMAQGLPLADPSQQGVLLKGQVIQAYGNWIGLDMTVELLCAPGFMGGAGSSETPRHIVLDWKAGQPLSAPLASALTAAFPGVPQQINISPNLILNYDNQHWAESLSQFSSWLQSVTMPLGGANYNGVTIAFQGETLIATDNTQQPSPKQINYQDLIGQPTWIDTFTIQITTVLRGDIKVNDYVQLPPTPTTANAVPQVQLAMRDPTTFTGQFWVNSIRHVGRSRQPTAESWVTIFEAVQKPPPDTSGPLTVQS